MSAGRAPLSPAYVLHTRAYRDTSLLIEIFTPHHGRMSLLAKGVKTGKQKRHAMLQPFRPLHVSWAGRGELPVLSNVEEADGGLRLHGVELACGYYLNELLYRLLPRDEVAVHLFASYWPTLQAVLDEIQREPALRCFELDLLNQIGYQPVLDHNVQTGAAVRCGEQYRYQVPHGPVTDAVGVSGLKISGDALLAMQRRQFDNLSLLREARDLLRLLLHHQLEGEELQSRKLFRLFTRDEASDANRVS